MDAICINQDDPAEKNMYVPLIGSVYEQAEQVLVWLGEEKDGMLAVRPPCFPGAVSNRQTDLQATALSTVILGRHSFLNDMSWATRFTVDTIRGRSQIPGKINLMGIRDAYRRVDPRRLSGTCYGL